MPKTTIQISPELDQRIQAIADRNHRSKHGQMLTYIERGVDQDENRAELAALGVAVNAFEHTKDPDARDREVAEALNSLLPAPRQRAIAYLIDRYGEDARITIDKIVKEG